MKDVSILSNLFSFIRCKDLAKLLQLLLCCEESIIRPYDFSIDVAASVWPQQTFVLVQSLEFFIVCQLFTNVFGTDFLLANLVILLCVLKDGNIKNINYFQKIEPMVFSHQLHCRRILSASMFIWQIRMSHLKHNTWSSLYRLITVWEPCLWISDLALKNQIVHTFSFHHVFKWTTIFEVMCHFLEHHCVLYISWISYQMDEKWFLKKWFEHFVTVSELCNACC